MSWFGKYHGSFLGRWFGALVDYVSRAKRGVSYVFTKAVELFVATKTDETTVRKRGR